MSQVPTRLHVLRMLQAHLQQITPDNGYAFDLSGDRVQRGRIIIGSEVAPPLLSIVEAPQPDAGTMFAGDWSEQRRDNWPLLLQGIVVDDKINPTDGAYELQAAVEVQLSRIVAVDTSRGEPLHPTEHMLGGLITSLEIGRAVIRPPEGGVSAYAFFLQPIRVGLSAPVGQPYTTA